MVGVRQPMAGVVYAPEEDLRRYLAAGLFADETLGEAFSRIAATVPDRFALSEGQLRMTFAQADELTDRIAAGLLQMGLRPLDRAIFQVGNGRQLVLGFIACLKAGVIPVATLTAHRRAEIGYLAEHAKARAHFICSDDPKFVFVAFAREIRKLVPSLAYTVVARGPSPRDENSFTTLEALAELGSTPSARARLAEIERDPFQVAVFQLSGGTSGIPKIIPRFHNEYLYQIRSVAALHGLDEQTVAFSPNPMMHNAPIICYWGPALWTGGEVVCSTSMRPEAIAEALERRPDWMCIPLPLLLNLKEAGLLDRDDFREARMTVSSHVGGLRELTGAKAIPLYGMTEGLISYGRIGDSERVLQTTVGRPVSPLDEFRIVDPATGERLPDGEVGEFCFKGPSSTRGYYDATERNREAFTADGLVKSGDLMRVQVIDGTRYVSFEGRVKDVVSRGGEKINCQEVERVLTGHPAVGAISIVPMPDPVYGERSCAFVIPVRGAAAPSVQDFGAFLEAAGLAKFKWPERVEIVTEFPTTSSGKLSKPRLREMISTILQSEKDAAGRPDGAAPPRVDTFRLLRRHEMDRNSLHENYEPHTTSPDKLTYRNPSDIATLKPAKQDSVQLRLHGVDHTARPTWKLRETVTFYRDILGLPLIHTISARGWGHEDHADFLHFFFDAGDGATIAFFYYVGTEQPDMHAPSNHPFYTANHTAWAVETMDELRQWKETLEGRGVVVSPYTRHEAIESIYFRDPNGYPVEITLRLREVEAIDAIDAGLTLEAAMQIEDASKASGEKMRDIDTVWRRKAKLVEEHLTA